MANIKQIAKMAGVSVTTVSRVLNNHPYVSDAKRKAVLEVVERLNYTQNLNAVHLAKGKTYTIGVALPFVNHPHFSAILQGIASEALKYSYRFIMCQTNYAADEEIKALQLLQMKQIDGIIICSKTSDWNEIEPYTAFGPIVACEDTGIHEISCVHIDHYRGFFLGMQHLIQKGHRKIGYCIARGNSFNSLQRKQAYENALQQIEEPVRKEWMFEQCLDIEDGARVMRQWLVMKQRPTALLVAGDYVAAGIITEAKKHGVRVPEDLAVVGFDNHPISRVLDITTIEHPSVHLGETAFQIIYRHIQNETYHPRKKELPFRLIERSTT
jgi:DNA-binding LacI/PurR family transcriptional regulator